MRQYLIEIPFNIFNSNKVDKARQDTFKKFLNENNFWDVKLDFDKDFLDSLVCTTTSIREIDGEIQSIDDVQAAQDILKLLKDNDYLDLERLKEFYDGNDIVFIYPTEPELLYSMGLDQLD